MQKKTRKLTLAKETLGRLEGKGLDGVAGGNTANKTCTCATLDRTCTLNRTCPCSYEFECTANSCNCTVEPNC